MTAPVYQRLHEGWQLRIADHDAAIQRIIAIYEGIAVAFVAPEYAQAILAELPEKVRASVREAAVAMLDAFPVEVAP